MSSSTEPTTPTPTTVFQDTSVTSLYFRWSTVADIEPAAKRVAAVFGVVPEVRDIMAMRARRLMSGRNPSCGPTEVLLAIDPVREKEGNDDYVVSTLFFLKMEMEVEGCRFSVFQPELVSSDPLYRKQGIIRNLFQIAHKRCDEEGIFVQRIMGIPHFYRRFGYEYATPLLASRAMLGKHIPALKEDEDEPYILRPSIPDDIPIISRLHSHGNRRSLLCTYLSPKNLDFFVSEPLYPINPTAGTQSKSTYLYHTLTDALTEDPVGLVVLWSERWSENVRVMAVEVDEKKVSLIGALPSLLRGVKAAAETCTKMKADLSDEVQGLTWTLGEQHPIYEALGEHKLDPPGKSDAWYMRVSDHVAFLRTIAPVLEARLAGSEVCKNWTGKLLINLYTKALKVEFDGGKFVAAEYTEINWTSRDERERLADMHVPELVFVKLLFGVRSLDQLTDMFTDVDVNSDLKVVVETLFPRKSSTAIPVTL
ncbi:GNAT domain-containing protein [Endogone sp. FLAS-F59071]|nr:GNAT domain-containing protein [Endogone sp. FLAS-F59071]|eukprot:RUS14575.1 GNAT domain-containing protein [Endogone sp. FLAS-F59071]